MFVTFVRDTLAHLSLPCAVHPPRKSRSDFSFPSMAVADGKNARPECGVQNWVVPRDVELLGFIFELQQNAILQAMSRLLQHLPCESSRQTECWRWEQIISQKRCEVLKDSATSSNKLRLSAGGTRLTCLLRSSSTWIGLQKSLRR